MLSIRVHGLRQFSGDFKQIVLVQLPAAGKIETVVLPRKHIVDACQLDLV
jgi:hypothetical protein